MRFFDSAGRLTSPELPGSGLESRIEDNRIPATYPTNCIQEACPHYSGIPCENSFYEWYTAKDSVKGNCNRTRPPRSEEAVFVSYGQICLQGGEQIIVRYRVNDYGREIYASEETELIVEGNCRFGRGIDVEVYDVTSRSDGTLSEQLRHVYDG